MSETDTGDFVQSLARGLAVIRCFDGEHPTLTLSEVARRAGIPRAAAARFLRTLATLGYVRMAEREFSLTPRVLELGYSYLASLSLPEKLQPHMEDLSRTLGESVSAAVLDGVDVTYIARVPTRRIMSVQITIGTRFPAVASSLGRVLLSSLAEEALDDVLTSSSRTAFTDRTITDVSRLRAEIAIVRQQGWALVDGELEPGLRSIAAPVRDVHGVVVAAINVSTSSTRHTTVDLVDDFLPHLLATACQAGGSSSPTIGH